MIRNYLLSACLSVVCLFSATAPAAEPIVIGGKNFTEQLLIAEITGQYLKANGFEVDERTGMGSPILRSAQENGQIDLYWEYTGTALQVFHKIETVMSPEKAYETIKELDAKKGLTWLAPSKANNTWALAVRNDGSLTIDTISDLAQALNAGQQIPLAAGVEFVRRKDALIGLSELYQFKYPIKLIKTMEIGLTYDALRNKSVDLAVVFATDGRITAFNFKVLKDDKHFFPSYAMTPVVRTKVLEQHPELATLLNAISAKLDDAVMQRLNAEVDVNKKPVRDVAREFLVSEKLL